MMFVTLKMQDRKMVDRESTTAEKMQESNCRNYPAKEQIAHSKNTKQGE